MHVVIDAMNVLGSRPDGWWRDRDGALRRLAAEVGAWAATVEAEVWLVADGRPVAGLEGGRHGVVEVRYARRGGRDAADDRIVELVATLDADSRPGDAAVPGRTPQNGAPTSNSGGEPDVEGESSGSANASESAAPGRAADVEVVTADAELRARVGALGARVTGPRTFLTRIAPPTDGDG